MKNMNKYLINIHEFYDVEVEADSKAEATLKALDEYENHPSRYYNGCDVAGVEEIRDSKD